MPQEKRLIERWLLKITGVLNWNPIASIEVYIEHRVFIQSYSRFLFLKHRGKARSSGDKWTAPSRARNITSAEWSGVQSLSDPRQHSLSRIRTRSIRCSQRRRAAYYSLNEASRELSYGAFQLWSVCFLSRSPRVLDGYLPLRLKFEVSDRVFAWDLSEF